MMISFSQIAIFILATTKQLQHESCYDTRILPITKTWGSFFPHLYFVLGSNINDYRFLAACTYIRSNIDDNNTSGSHASSNHRQLFARPNTQTKQVNQTTLYQCNSDADEPINFLFVGNCTGEYFGIGPVCRYQESLRYYLHAEELKEAKYFLFLDDDVYIRPYALLSMLTEVDAVNRRDNNIKGYSSKSIGREQNLAAYVSSSDTSGFKFSGRWKETGYNCNNKNITYFPLAQPCLLSKSTVLYLENAIDSNALTSLHAIWGGSADSLAGLLLWMYEVPTYSMQSFYKSGGFFKLNNSITIVDDEFQQYRHFIIHQLRNMKVGRIVGKKEFGQYDMALHFNDRLPCNDTVIDEQIRIGKSAVYHLVMISKSGNGIVKTSFYSKDNSSSSRIAVNYRDFHIQDC